MAVSLQPGEATDVLLDVALLQGDYAGRVEVSVVQEGGA